MKKELKVFLHDQYAGNLIYENGHLSFSYHPSYLKNVYARAIATTMPLSQEIYPHQIVYPFFSGLLPARLSHLDYVV